MNPAIIYAALGVAALLFTYMFVVEVVDRRNGRRIRELNRLKNIAGAQEQLITQINAYALDNMDVDITSQIIFKMVADHRKKMEQK